MLLALARGLRLRLGQLQIWKMGCEEVGVEPEGEDRAITPLRLEEEVVEEDPGVIQGIVA